MSKELSEYHELNKIGTYSICLIGYSRGKGSYRIYYSEPSFFVLRLNYLQEELRKRGYEIYRIAREKKDEPIGVFTKRVYFRKVKN